MFFWSGFPFIRVVIFFAAGIVLAVYLPHWQWLMLWIGILAGVAWLLLLAGWSRWFIRLNYLYGFTASLLWISLGWFFLTAATESRHPGHILHVQPGDAYAARLISSPLRKGRFFQLKAEVEAVHDTTGWHPAGGKLLLYLDTAAGQPQITDRLVISGWPQPVAPPRNPYEFDYRQFLAFNNIWHRQFVRAGQVRWVAVSHAFSLSRLAFQMRSVLQDQLQRYIKDDQALAVIQALLLGNKNDLDATTTEAYARAGAMHVLAVSGLHVGIIYLILLLLLGQRPDRVTRPVLVGAVVIPALWLYALLTGLSPSVMRAVTMFSLLAVGYMFKRQANTFNMLAVSAFILLVANPYLLMSVGFQLSYLAVAGILLFYPYLESIWKPTSRPWRLLWQITALSVAAQLATAPLSALYFHRFPVYFPVSNLLVIPAATLIVWGGIGLLLLATFAGPAAQLLGLGLTWLVKLVNSVLLAIGNWPGANIADLAPGIAETWLIYGLLMALYLYFVYRQKTYRYLAYSLALLLATALSVYEYRAMHLKQIVFYSTGRDYAIDLVDNRQYISLMDSSLQKNSEKVAFLITPYRRKWGLRPAFQAPTTGSVAGLGRVVVWRGYKILLAAECLDKEQIPAAFDFVLLPAIRGTNCAANRVVLCKFVKQGQMMYKAHDLTRQGALLVNIN